MFEDSQALQEGRFVLVLVPTIASKVVRATTTDKLAIVRIKKKRGAGGGEIHKKLALLATAR
jgi:hypothetical protein